MNTTMADGVHDRLDAQIAEALFGQPGMSKMDVANRVRELRGDGPALLVGGQTAPAGQIDAETLWWLQDAINTMAEGGNQSHVRFLQRLHDTLAVQPSPGGQGDARAIIAEFIQCATLGRPHGKLIAQAKDYLAAHQPVGEPVAWMTHHDEPMLYPTFQEAAAYCDDDEPPIPLYASQPAQAVDLGMPIAMIDQALGHLSTALEDLHSSPDARPGAMVTEAMGCLRQALTGVQP